MGLDASLASYYLVILDAQSTLEYYKFIIVCLIIIIISISMICCYQVQDIKYYSSGYYQHARMYVGTQLYIGAYTLH